MSVYLHLDSIARRDAYVPNIRFSVSATTTQDLGSVFGALTITANRIERIQKRTITFDSGQPISSKW